MLKISGDFYEVFDTICALLANSRKHEDDYNVIKVSIDNSNDPKATFQFDLDDYTPTSLHNALTSFLERMKKV